MAECLVPRTRALILLWCGLLLCLPAAHAQESQQNNPYQSQLTRLEAMFVEHLPDWKAHVDNLPHGEDPALNDADWSPARVSEPWGSGPTWFRRSVEVPRSLGGYDIAGARLRLDLRVTAEGSSQVRVFFNGSLVEMGDDTVQQPILLTEKAEPGQKILVAVDVPLATGPARIEIAELVVDFPPDRATPALLFNEIRAAQAMVAGLANGQAERAQQLDAAVKAIDFGLVERGDQPGFEKSLQAAQEKLQPLGEWAKQFTVRAVANSHIDMAWLWPWTETVEVVRNTFGTVLQLMRQYPDYIYAQSAAQDYVWMEEKYPDLFKEIQQRVKEGRWEIVGGMWVEPDLNMPAGESLVRQILVGKRYFQQKFGVDVRIGWNPDSFGYNWQLPQIYKRSGLDYFITQKMSWNDTTKFPYKLFWWQSPDGSRVLTYFPHDYVNRHRSGARFGRCGRVRHQDRHARDSCNFTGLATTAAAPRAPCWTPPCVGRTAPTSFPKLTFSTAQSYFNDVEKKMGDLKIPVWNNELYFQYHRGVMTTQSETKKRIRKAKNCC